MHLRVKISNQFSFQRVEGWALIRGVGAYSRKHLLDIPLSTVGAYPRGHLIEALQYTIYIFLKKVNRKVLEIIKIYGIIVWLISFSIYR